MKWAVSDNTATWRLPSGRNISIWAEDGNKAGAGIISDGVPVQLGDGGASEKQMPPPIGTKVRLLHDTIPMRKVQQ